LLRAIRAVSLLFLIGGLAAPVMAQRDPRVDALEVRIPGSVLDERDRPEVVTHGVLDGTKIRDLMAAAFPAQLHFRLELWKKNPWVDEFKGFTEWDVLVSFDPTTKRYAVRRRHGTQTEEFPSFASIAEAIAFVERPYRVPQIARGVRGEQYYYLAHLDVMALQNSDLEAVQRWLKGDLQPAIRGKRNPFAAVREGLGTMLSRVIGGDRRRYEDRSAIFTAG
jgi:hypothetical protein